MIATGWRAVLGLAVVVALALPMAQVQAQGTDMSEDAMTQALARQKTRGLTLAPTTAPAAGAPAAAGAGAVVKDFAVLPKEEQVNINISFDFDSAALRDDQKPRLASLCRAVKTAGVGKLRIVGHTDAAGSDDYNARLSLLRAEEVRRHLSETCAIPMDQMEAVGMGKQFLFDPADPRGEVNRRVEFQALS